MVQSGQGLFPPSAINSEGHLTNLLENSLKFQEWVLVALL